MSSYIHFTEEQKQRAAAVDLEEFLRCRGEKLLSSGREKRLASDHSVTVRGNEWYDHAEERGGHAVSFVQRFYGLSYPDAVTMLLGGELGTAYPSAGERTEEPVKPFALPPANRDMRRVFAYLIKHRGIASFPATIPPSEDILTLCHFVIPPCAVIILGVDLILNPSRLPV